MGILRDTVQLAPLMFGRSHGRADRVYEFLAGHHAGERTLYLNLGYWKDAKTFDVAAEALARELAIAVGMRRGDVVVDCGFGFADQDLYWTEAFGPSRIVGLNVTPIHVETAKKRVEALGLGDRIELHLGSATEMPVPDSSVDRVTALESAFHFVTREDFMREAFRVLRPRGRFAAADILPREDRPQTFAERLDARVFRRFWQIPLENYYPASVYRSKLEAVGFREVEVRSIRDHVYDPYAEFLRARLEDPVIATRMNALIKSSFKAATAAGYFNQYDYVIAIGEKPGEVDPDERAWKDRSMGAGR